MKLNFIEILTTGISVILFNGLFYWLIKNRIDNRINKFKITYSGVFSEKIKIYRKLLKLIIDIEENLQFYINSPNEKKDEKIILSKFSKMNKFRIINQAFLSNELNLGFQNIINENQDLFDIFFISRIYELNNNMNKETLQKKISALQKLSKNPKYQKLKDQIIVSMKKELNT